MELSKKNMKKIATLLTFAIFLFFGLQNYIMVTAVIKKIFAVCLPFILGFSIAFILNVLLRPTEHLWDIIWKAKNRGFIKKLQRPVCLILVLCFATGVIVVLFFMVIPDIVRTVSSTANLLPGFINSLEPRWNALTEKLHLTSLVLPKLAFDKTNMATSAVDFFKKYGSSLFSKALGFTASLFLGVFNLLIGMIFSIFVLFEKETLFRQFKKVSRAFIPERIVDKMLDIASISGRIFSNFVKGQLAEAAILGILCLIGMLIFSLPYAVAISALVGFTALIPVFGTFVGIGAGVFIVLIGEPHKAIWFLVFILVLKQIETNLIYPFVVGKYVGLPGIWVFVAVTIGGSLFGLIGILISAPVCSVIYCLLHQTINNRLSRKQIKSAEG